MFCCVLVCEFILNPSSLTHEIPPFACQISFRISRKLYVANQAVQRVADDPVAAMEEDASQATGQVIEEIFKLKLERSRIMAMIQFQRCVRACVCAHYPHLFFLISCF